jgi:phospholipase C
MTAKHLAFTAMRAVRTGLISTAIFQLAIGSAFASDQTAKTTSSRDNETATPIKHVIVIIGENRTFDHIFATYVPVKGQTVFNLLSEGIVKADGTPGPNFPVAEQKAAYDVAPDAFMLSPDVTTSFAGNVLPAPINGGPTDSYVKDDSLTLARQSENGLPKDYYAYLVTGGSGLTGKVPDTRITNVNALPPGPFQLTNGDTFSYNSYAASPVHRFYQMWQQLDCSVAHATATNPSGCDSALFPWVEATVGAGTNGLAQPANFSTDYSPSGVTTGEGSTAMGFYNVQNGDAPYFKYLADNYAMSDNFHQSVNGGTGANHIMFGHGDMIYFSDGKGNAVTPPHKVATGAGVNRGVVDEVENPNPAPSTNNWYTEDGYGGGSFGASSYGGGSYTNCADTTQPGVKPIVTYLKSLTTPIKPNCEAGHYYLLNNYNPGYFGNGNNAYTDTNAANTVFTIPPSSVPSIGDDLLKNNVSWKYYGDQWNNYVPDPYQLNYGAVGKDTDEYCNICNPFQYDTSIMGNASVRTAHIQDTANLYKDIKDGNLPAVSIVKPSGLVDGHPSSSKLDLFEGFTKKIVDEVKKNPKLWKDTAIFITEDEGGGYYDSGYVQPLDYFGDGTRIPLIVVSPYTKAGHISHDYADHVSILKFIEANWKVAPVSSRSRDNYPNPVARSDNAYVPTNSPAIDDLMSLFNF